MITPYLRLASVLPVGFLASLIISSHMFVKMSTFGVGFAFFGDPIIRRGVAYLNREFPRWEKLLELQKYASLQIIESIISSTDINAAAPSSRASPPTPSSH